MNRFLGALIGVSLLHGVGISQQSPSPENDIADRIGRLRSLPDARRAVETKTLALQISGLKSRGNKLGLALSLSNLATEGDFGQDTLQDVTDALVMGVSEDMSQGHSPELTAAYTELAQLAVYEGMRVHLQARGYILAVAELKKQDQVRDKNDFTLTDIEGKTWTRSALKGKVVVVNFWATWCPPCRKEMPDLNALYAQFKNKGLVIVALSDEKPEVVKAFIKKMGYTYPILLDPGGKVAKSYFVEGIPKSFFYNRSGHLAAQSIDMRTRGQFLKLLAKAGLK